MVPVYYTFEKGAPEPQDVPDPSTSRRLDRDLQRLIDAWPETSDERKRIILDLVE